MSLHDIFIFTSDRKEGWGAVANEAMTNGAVIVASANIGSVPYLIEDKKTGLIFHSPSMSSSFNHPDKKSLDDLCQKIEWLIDNPTKRQEIAQNAFKKMHEIFSPQVAAKRLILLIESLTTGKDTPFLSGPCSKA